MAYKVDATKQGKRRCADTIHSSSELLINVLPYVLRGLSQAVATVATLCLVGRTSLQNATDSGSASNLQARCFTWVSRARI